MEVSSRVRELVRARFTEKEASDIIQAFELAEPPGVYHTEDERLQVAILKYAANNSVKVFQMIELSDQDFRDVLVAGGLANLDSEAVMEAYLREAKV